MKQHKDIREILKRSGTAPTGICGFWRSAASFAAALFGAFAAFKFLAGIYLGAGGFGGSASRYGSCGGVGTSCVSSFPLGASSCGFFCGCFTNIQHFTTMGKVTLLFAGKSYDTDVQNVRENQIVIFDGPYNMRQRMVVAGIAHTQSGYNYRLIDPETAEEHTADLIRPLRDKFGIGHYYDDEHPEFMDASEVAALRTRADALKAEQEAARRAAADDAERLRTIGAERLRQIVPDDAVAVIIGEQHESECDPYTDYFGSRIVRTVLLGFSTHTRDLFPEMRKAAARFEGTAHLAERNAEYEHREKYSMGHGYYLGTHRYSGWQVSKESCRDKEGIIKRFAVVAGNPENVCIENPAPVQNAAPETVADARVEIVEYSAKSIAVFGDTKPLRDTLRDLNGLFRAYLTHDGTRCAGWIFSKRREQEVRSALAAYLK